MGEGGYKLAKEEFVSGMTGSSITHINLISLIALAAVSLYAAIRTRISPSRNVGFLASWSILVLPMLLSMTIAANHPLYLNMLLVFAIIFVLRIPRAEFGTPLPRNIQKSPSMQSKFPMKGLAMKIPPLPGLTTYRAHMMLMTVLAILAVDFPVFPRSLAKCETFGVSLMDLGVGSFVFSQGIVSAIPMVKEVAHLKEPMFPKLLRVTKKSLPVIALGLIRVLLVKGTEYPEHVTEYGVHWNFFITLALLPVLQVLLHPVLVHLPISFVGVVVGAAQHIILNRFRMKEYVLFTARTSIFSANKEGIVSLLGYLSIQLLGLSAGTLVLPQSPSVFRRRQQALSLLKDNNKKRRSDPQPQLGSSPPLASSGYEDHQRNSTQDDNGLPNFTLNFASPRQLDKTATELCAYAILWWSLLGFAKLTGIDGRWSNIGEGGISRRMVNISYILWVAAFNVSFLLCYIVILDLWIFGTSATDPDSDDSDASDSGSQSQSKHPKTKTDLLRLDETPTGDQLHQEMRGNPPILLEVVNKHSLGVFLLANVLTGAINLSISTMYMSDAKAFLILSVYSIVLCVVPWIASAHGKEK